MLNNKSLCAVTYMQDDTVTKLELTQNNKVIATIYNPEEDGEEFSFVVDNVHLFMDFYLNENFSPVLEAVYYNNDTEQFDKINIKTVLIKESYK